MTLDPQARVYLDKLASLNLPPFHTMKPDDARRLMADLLRESLEDASKAPAQGV